MSRIGRAPVTIPAGVEVVVNGSYVKVKGPKGELEQTFPEAIEIRREDGSITVHRPSDEPAMRALHGMTRALINNMVVGVSSGFERILEVVGVGYRAEMSGKDLILNVGYSHPVNIPAPEGITFEVDTKTKQIKIKGRDKHQVGQVANDIRKIRPPEPYKGYGVRYLGEAVRRKAGKAGKMGK